MQISESWLRTLVNPALNTEQLAHCLTMAGLEVEDTRPVAPPFSGVVVARIVETAPHPDADRLRVCKVDDGSGSDLLQIVCGAPNAQEGLLVPLARIGAVLPDDFTIKKMRMRGVESMGMLCSARELGLSEDHAGLLELPPDLKVGLDIRDALNLDDALLTLKLTPNRADCLSILGIAREVAALTHTPLKRPISPPAPVCIADRLPVNIHAPDLCGRFAGRIIKGVNARAATPRWMVERLERSGQRSISALVDISNYVMLELGRPTHVYDLAVVNGGFGVRWARAGESLELLNGQTVELAPDVGLITTTKDDAPCSLAGIMGGAASAVTLDTTDVFIEAAFWHPEAIMGRSRRYKFSSEASHRFERGVDFEGLADDLERMTALILDICGGQAGPLDDHIAKLPKRATVAMRLARCCKVLGITVTREQVSSIFGGLGLPHEWQDDTVRVQAPSWRFDINIEEDLIEEVARVYGFENLPDAPPTAPAVMLRKPETRRTSHELRANMAALGWQEVINFSFVDEAWEQAYSDNNAPPIRLLNPIASQLSVMRSNLMAGLVANVRHNAQRQQNRVRVFELGRVFSRDERVANGDLSVAGIRQPLHLAGAAWGNALPEQWAASTRAVDFYDVKNDLTALFGGQAGSQTPTLRFEANNHPALHPGRSARLLFNQQPIGWLGELHPRLAQENELASAPVLFEVELEPLLAQALPHARPLSRQPVVQRDLAIWVDESVTYQTMHDTLMQTIAANANLAIVRQVALFDVWRDGKHQDPPSTPANPRKSLALRFYLQHTQTTLDDAAIERCMEQLLDALVQAHNVSLRNG